MDHKRTIFWLEQLILKHQAHSKCTTIQQMPGGIDFFFSERSHARSFIEFLQSIAPVRSTMAKKLISHNIHESTYNYKFTFMIEVVPVCKDDLVLLPKRLANSLGADAAATRRRACSSAAHTTLSCTRLHGTGCSCGPCIQHCARGGAMVPACG